MLVGFLKLTATKITPTLLTAKTEIKFPLFYRLKKSYFAHISRHNKLTAYISRGSFSYLFYVGPLGMQHFFSEPEFRFHLGKQTNDILLQVPKDPLNFGMVKIVNWMKTNDDKPIYLPTALHFTQA